MYFIFYQPIIYILQAFQKQVQMPSRNIIPLPPQSTKSKTSKEAQEKPLEDRSYEAACILYAKLSSSTSPKKVEKPQQFDSRKENTAWLKRKHRTPPAVTQLSGPTTRLFKAANESSVRDQQHTSIGKLPSCDFTNMLAIMCRYMLTYNTNVLLTYNTVTNTNVQY